MPQPQNLAVRTPGIGAQNALNFVGGVAYFDADGRKRGAASVRVLPPCSVKKDSVSPTTTTYFRWVRDDEGEIYMEKIVTVSGETEIYWAVGLWSARESIEWNGEDVS